MKPTIKKLLSMAMASTTILYGFAQTSLFDNFDDYIIKSSNFTIKEIGEIVPKSKTETTDTYVIYSGRDVSFGAKTSLQKDSIKIISKDTKILMYNSGAINGAQFPVVSNLIEQSNSSTYDKVYVFGSKGGKYIGIPSIKRGTLTSQLCGEAHYKEINVGKSTTKPTFSFFGVLDLAEPKFTITPTFNYDKLFPGETVLTACHNYYLAYCGDKVIDVGTDDLSKKDGAGGVIITKVDGTSAFTKRTLKPLKDEACDSNKADGTTCVNGTAGCCKTDCSGFEGAVVTCPNGVVDAGEICDPQNLADANRANCKADCNGYNPIGSFVITKSIVGEKSAYNPGDTLQFRIDFTNGTSQTGSKISIEDLLPASSFDFLSGLLVGVAIPYTYGTIETGGYTSIIYSGFTMSPGQTGYMLISAKIKSTVSVFSNSTTLNTAIISGTLTDNTTFIKSATKLVNGNITALPFIKETSKSTYNPGENATFTITLTNNGAYPLNNFTLEDVWPNTSCFTESSRSDGGISSTHSSTATGSLWKLQTIPVGQIIKITVAAKIKADANCAGAYTNTANISYTDPSNTIRTATTNVPFNVSQIVQNLKVVKTVKDAQSKYGAGDEITFLIAATNNGDTDLVGYKIVDYWPTTLGTPTTTSSVPFTITSGNPSIVSWDFSAYTLKKGATKTVEITGKIK